MDESEAREARHRRNERRGWTAAVIFASYLVGSWAIVAVLLHGLVPHAAWIVVAAALYTTLPIATLIAFRGWPFYPGTAFRVLVVRGVLYGQLLLPFVAAAGLVGVLVGAPFGAALLVGRVVAAAVLALLIGFLLAGYAGSRRLVVREVEARVPGLPHEFEGLRIVQISDLHVGPHTPRAFLRRVLSTVNAMRPDVIAVTGDLVDDRAEDVAPYAASLGALRAPLGVVMIPGNHDVYAGWEAVERNLARAVHGTILVNDVHLLRRGSATLALLGTGDPAGRSPWSEDARVAPDLDRAFARVPANAPVIAFAHNPVLWPPLAERGTALTLSGHTHWGQFAIPRLRWSLASPFLAHAMGGHRDGDALLYISPGTGYWGIPFRLGALPEVTVVTLRGGEEAGLAVGEARRAA